MLSPCIQSRQILLTESALLDVLRSKSKYREQLNHYLHDDIGHRRGQRNVAIDSNACKESSETFEQVDERIIARADATGRLWHGVNMK